MAPPSPRHDGARRRFGDTEATEARARWRTTTRREPVPVERDPARRARHASEQAEAYLAERRRRLRQLRGR